MIKKPIFLLSILLCWSAFSAQSRDVYLHGSFNNWTDKEGYKFEPVGEGENHYRLIVTIPATSSPHKFKVYDKVESGQKYRGSSSTSDTEIDLNGVVKSLNSHSGSGNESSVTLSNPVELRLCFEYWAKWKFSGDNDEKYHSALKVTTCPESLYLYGHLKNGDWNKGYFYEGENIDGGYYFSDVNISGRSGNENYIAFYGELPSPSNYSSLFPRYGGNSADKNIDSAHSNGQNVVILESDFSEENDNKVTKKIDVFTSRPSAGDSNFRLHDGMYDIFVNLAESKVEFKKVDLSFTWHDADGNIIEDNAIIRLTLDSSYQLRLFSRDNQDHPVARNAQLTITYTPNSSEIMMISEEDEIPDYSIDEDGLISLNKVGTYTITASLPEELKADYLGVEDSTITAIVEETPTSINTIEERGSQKEFFNLQGERILEPQNGIFIKVENGKAEKIIIK